MTRESMLRALAEEIESLTDEDISALSKYGYESAEIHLAKPQHSANLNCALFNVSVTLSHEQYARLQKIRGGP